MAFQRTKTMLRFIVSSRLYSPPAKTSTVFNFSSPAVEDDRNDRVSFRELRGREIRIRSDWLRSQSWIHGHKSMITKLRRSSFVEACWVKWVNSSRSLERKSRCIYTSGRIIGTWQRHIRSDPVRICFLFCSYTPSISFLVRKLDYRDGVTAALAPVNHRIRRRYS